MYKRQPLFQALRVFCKETPLLQAFSSQAQWFFDSAQELAEFIERVKKTPY